MGASHVQSWRNRTKVRMLEAMGNSCQICGYDKCSAALEFHHIDPSGKEFTFATAMKNPSSWDKLVVELRKCVLLCANCHRELHYSSVSLSGVESGFDERYAEYGTKEVVISLCPVCGKNKSINAVTCSVACARKRSRIVDWDTVDVHSLVDKYKNPEQVGKYLGVSGAAVRKRIKKLNAEKYNNAD